MSWHKGVGGLVKRSKSAEEWNRINSSVLLPKIYWHQWIKSEVGLSLSSRSQILFFPFQKNNDAKDKCVRRKAKQASTNLKNIKWPS